ncbi:MAG: methylthioribulose 1-phosphate dehydratase [Vampirovibrionales bacterium]|nr:methylthioribulose 1-phosphate dehydratase [Vampirovibrionales bacterium]
MAIARVSDNELNQPDATPPEALTTTTEMAEGVSEAIRFFHRQGWCPATSSNFSFRPNLAQNEFHISVSGLDKANFSANDFLPMNMQGHLSAAELSASSGANLKPSAETLLHALIYQNDPEAAVVLHMHSPNAVVFSKLMAEEPYAEFSDYEILKGFAGITTHETSVRLPIYPNSQDMAALSKRIGYDWQDTPLQYGFLLRGHGLYAWGKSVAEAKRHVEVFEYLFECERKLIQAS